MKKTLALIAAVVVSVALIVANAAAPGHKWEYKVFHDSTGNVENELTKLGSEHWELVSVAATTREGNNTSYYFYLKREKAE